MLAKNSPSSWVTLIQDVVRPILTHFLMCDYKKFKLKLKKSW